MDRGAWWAAVHGVAKSRTWLSDFTFIFHFHTLEKEMAIHSSVLAWRIPGTGEPGGLLSMGLHRVGHYWSDLAAVAAAVAVKMITKHNDASTNALHLWVKSLQHPEPWIYLFISTFTPTNSTKSPHQNGTHHSLTTPEKNCSALLPFLLKKENSLHAPGHPVGTSDIVI